MQVPRGRADLIKDVAKNIRHTSAVARETAEAFHESGAVMDLVGAVHDAWLARERHYKCNQSND